MNPVTVQKFTRSISEYDHFLIKMLYFLTISCSSSWFNPLFVYSAGRGRSWEDQPGFSGREKRPGRYLLGPEALLRQHLPGAAGCSHRLSVAPFSGPGWDCPHLEHAIALQRRSRLTYDISTQQKGSKAGLCEPQSHTLTPVHQEGFSKVYFSLFS